ncbi:MAG: tetratricopeptide repeat protein [Kiritimatiellae bacterium]|nr:tetratricopeptide repeat protein [Kiritimatiellia bacterium]
MTFLAALAWLPAWLGPLENFDPPKRFLMALLAAGLLWRHRTGGSAARAVCLPVLLLLGWMSIRTLLRPDRWNELGVLAVWALPAVLFLAGAAGDWAAARSLGNWLLAATALQCILMLLQRCGFDPLFSATTGAIENPAGRMIGTIGYQNQAAAFVAQGAGAALLLSRRRCAKIVVFAFAFLCVCLTGCRGALLAMLAASVCTAGVMLLCVVRGRMRRTRAGAALAGLFVLMCATVFVVPTTRARLVAAARRGGQGRTAWATRALMRTIAWNMWAEKPFSGWGAGAYAHQYLDRLGRLLPETKDARILDAAVPARETHNDYLQFGAEFGVVGWAFVCFTAVAAARRAKAAWRHAPRAVGLLTYGAVYAGSHALVSFPWQMNMAGPLTGFVLGTALGRLASSSSQRKTVGAVPRAAAMRPLGIALTAASLLVAWFTLELGLQFWVPKARTCGAVQRVADRLPPWAHSYLAYLGATCAKKGQPGAAVPLLTRAQEGHRDVALLNNLGHCYAQLGKWPQAVRVYRTWVASGIDHEAALYNLSVAFENAGRFSEAADVLGRKLQLWPRASAGDHLRFCVLAMHAGRVDEALKHGLKFEREIKTKDFPPEFENLLGVLLLQLGREPEARGRFERALARKPDLESARRNLATITTRQP